MGSVNGFIKPNDTTYLEIKRINSFYEVQKRTLDIVLALPLLIILMPFLLVAAAAIKLDSPGPVLYRRKVVGRGKRAFYAFKLRTMTDGAESLVCEDPDDRKKLEENHKLQSDKRVTRVGQILRKTSIDEIPQLINVLLGQMSLVGPRMISFPELEKFGVWQDDILSVRPGITGLWQVSGRSKLSYGDRVQLNLYYVEHQSIGLDIYILLKTIPAVLTGDGAY